jgi:2-oxoisovalerate dehydrogenase E2 component (dihydrolipoyl transacylase)
VLTIHEGIHVGIATQTENGLVVPVLRHAEAHTIWSTATAITELSEATRTGRAVAGDLAGSTITITSLGPLGGIVTTPIINKPEVAIVGVNKIVVRPVWVDGEFVPRKIMNLSSSFDHRVVDGWDAANFVQSIRAQLEQPALLFIDEYATDGLDSSAQPE